MWGAGRAAFCEDEMIKRTKIPRAKERAQRFADAIRWLRAEACQQTKDADAMADPEEAADYRLSAAALSAAAEQLSAARD